MQRYKNRKDMKTQHFFCYLAVLAVCFTACKKNDDEQSVRVKKEVFSGYAQKGPFVNGSSVTISELKENLDQTGKTYFTTISGNSGSFEQKNIELISSYVELKADGYYFNEISGQTSAGTIMLYALVDIEDVNSANVNVLTHLEKPRVEYLVQQQGMRFPAAKQQAQREVLAIFGFESVGTTSETLDLTADAKLLAISSILQGYLSAGDMMELMADINADIKQDGKLDNMVLGTKLINNAFSINSSLSTIRKNLTNKYIELGNDVTIPDFESYIEAFINSELYPQTISVTYPATGSFGVNILSDDVTFLTIDNDYSMKAEVPEGLSLTIVLKSEAASPYYPWGIELSSPFNWAITTYDFDTQSQQFTVKEGGKISDLRLVIGHAPYIIVEYYENGATAPTKIKTLEVR